MNWNQLQYVITIAEEKSITKAAKRLFITQPSLSLSIRNLEKELGTALFEHNHGEQILTYAGRLFYEWSLSTLRSHQQLSVKLDDIAANTRKLLRIGISPHRSTIMLPLTLKRFYNIFPNCEVQVVEKPTYILKGLLDQNELDVLIDMPNPDTVNYQNDLLLEENMMLAVPTAFVDNMEGDIKDNTQADGSIVLTALAFCPFIMLPVEHHLGKMSRKLCEAAGFHPDTRITCNNLETALSFVQNDLGVTFVPEIFAKQNRFYKNVQYYLIRDFGGTRQICLVYRKNLYQDLQLRTLLDLFREIVPTLYQG